MSQQHLFRVKFKELNGGKNGGLGEVKSYKTTARDPQAAAKKMRKKGKILSVRRIK